MANTNNKQCQSCGLFCDCWKCNGSESPPCAKRGEDSQTPLNSQSDEIAVLRKEIQALREAVGHHQAFVGLHRPLGGNTFRLV
jgi:hypothetical protein